MKAKQTITATAAVAALAVTLWNRHTRNRSRVIAFECKCQREALETFEGEGGIVLT